MEPAVLEVVLDAGAADPADSTVDDHDLAVIDVAEPAQVPAELAVASQQADRGTRLRRPDDADLDARVREPVVESARASLRVGALPVDDEPDRNTSGRLCDQSIGEGLADDAWPEPELVDVDRGRGGVDVLEDRRVEVPPFDVNVDGRSAALGEREAEIVPVHGPCDEPVSALPDLADRADGSWWAHSALRLRRARRRRRDAPGKEERADHE